MGYCMHDMDTALCGDCGAVPGVMLDPTVEPGFKLSNGTRQLMSEAAQKRADRGDCNLKPRGGDTELTRLRKSRSAVIRVTREIPEEFNARLANAERAGFYSRKGRSLRDRDGDLCQLCLEPIDFTLRHLDPRGRTVDHIIPQRWGGGNEVENLWLAHRACNSAKSARFAGRADGTSDVRRAPR